VLDLPPEGTLQGEDHHPWAVGTPTPAKRDENITARDNQALVHGPATQSVSNPIAIIGTVLPARQRRCRNGRYPPLEPTG